MSDIFCINPLFYIGLAFAGGALLVTVIVGLFFLTTMVRGAK